jgi:A/G-specific adenine glycosylase
VRALSRLQHDLLEWFARNARDLPWRRTRDPYAIWVSEAMLQQTRVETVIGHFERFLARFPSVQALAAAEERDVLAAWSGLGYYRRARALQAAAREILLRHAGSFPRTLVEARALTGVGPYTAGAVLSIAYGIATPVVDGNVARVLARFYALEDPRSSMALGKRLWSLAESLLPGPGAVAGAWNQAVMELGATVCTPRAPACEACPIAHGCAARKAGRAESLPQPAKKRATLEVRLEIALVARGGELLLVGRPSEGRMAGLLEFPTREVPGPSGGLSGLWPAEFAPPLYECEPLDEIRHAITHHRIRARVRRATLAPGASATARLHWESPSAAGALGLTGMARKVLRGAAQRLFSVETPAGDQ